MMRARQSFLCGYKPLAQRRRSRGAAMLLVLIAVAMCTIMALSFLAAQEPTAAVASNIDRKVRARAIAESALQMAVDYVNEDVDWRSDKRSGTWLTDAAMDGGTFTLTGIDEVDGDLANDQSEAVLLSVVARYEGVTHRVSARVTPGAGPPPSNRLLLIAGSSSSPSSQDRAKRDLFESWGYTVTVFNDGSSDAEYAAALAEHDVVYVSEESVSGSIGDKLLGTPLGVVNEEGQLHDELRMAVSGADDYDSARTVTVLDNSHPVTAGLPLGEVAIYSSSRQVVNTSRSLGGGVTVLADGPGSDPDAAVFIADAGDGLTFNLAPGRRVILPFGDNFEIERLTDEGQRLVRQAIQWAEGASSSAGQPTLLALYEFNEQAVPDPALIGHWRLDEVASSVGGGFGGVGVGGKIQLKNDSVIDSYDSSLGAYGGANVGSDAYVATNKTSGVAVMFGTIRGNAFAGPGTSNVNQVIRSSGGNRVTVTGTRGVLSEALVLPSYDAPAGSFSNQGSETYDGQSVTWSSNLQFSDLDIKDDSRVTVSGDVTIHVTGTFTLDDESQITLANSSSSLTVYAAGDVSVKNESRVGSSADASRIRFVLYNTGDKFLIDDESQFSGTIESESDVEIKNESRVFGGVLSSGEVRLDDDSMVSVDRSQPTAGSSGGGGGAMPAAADQAVAANDGTYIGDAAGGAAGFGGGGTSVQFDGSGDYLEIPHDAAYLLDKGSIGLHFYPDRLGGQQALFSKDSSGNDNGGHLHLYADGTRLKARIQTTNDDPYGTGTSVELESSGSALSDGRWHHATVTWGDGQFRLYLNGALVDSANHLGGLGTTSGGSGNDEPIVIGAGSDTSGNQSATPISDAFTGRIDDVRIYDQAVDAGQAASLAAGSDPGSRTAPGYVIADTSGYETAADMLVYDPTAIAWVDGGGLTFVGDTLATTFGAATKIHDAIETNGAFSVEITFLRMTPGATDAPSHLLGYGNAPAVQNFLIGQTGSRYQARVRDSDTGTSGSLSPELVSASGLPSSRAVQLVLSYRAGEVRTYVDGVLEETVSTSGALDNWDETLPLVLGAAYNGGHHFNGRVDRIAIYDQAFDDEQAANVASGLPPGSGASTGRAPIVVWDEQD